jgi:hypothetical protein
MRASLAFAVALLATCQAALAGNTVQPTRIEVVPNFNAAGVYAYFDGDDNATATAKMEYRAGDAKDFRPGHPLSRTGKGRFAASIFWLKPDEPLEVRVTFDDPDAPDAGAPAQPAPLVATTRTRSEKFPAGTGKTHYVSPGGDDAGPGTREKPFKTIGHATGMAAPGDIIDVAAGDYFESVTVRRSGRPDAYITLRGQAAGQPAADGAAARPASRMVGSEAAPGPWQAADGGLFTLDEKRPVGVLTLAGTRAYHHVSLEELKAAAAPLVPGWWQDAAAGKVYVRTADGRPPAPATTRMGVLPIGLAFEGGGYWIIEGMAFECFGGGPYGRGIDIQNSPNIIVRQCSFDTMRTGVAVRKAGADDCLIEQCTFRDSGIWNWPWKEVKSHDTEGNGVDLRGGSGNVVRFCDFRGMFNGIGASTWGDLENETLNRDVDLHDNTFFEIGDDPLEPEGACMNVRFWNNRTRDTLQGISLAPITVGPVYVVRERYVNYKASAVKVSVNSRGIVFLYHILGWTDRPDGNAMGVSGPWDNMHFRNSILRGRKYVIEDSQQHPVGCTVDWCDLFSTGRQFIKWSGQRYASIAEMPPAAGFGRHNLRIEPYTRIENGEPADLAPELIDAGIAIPGINDDFKGKAPDLGPEEVK